MKDAFWQIKLGNYSSRLCTFNTPFGRCSFCRLLFGIKSAPEILQKRNMELFGDIPGVHIIFDDHIASHDEAEHDVIFRMVLERARRYNARFNRDKLQFKVKKVKFVGLQIAADGIRPDSDKVSAIVNMDTPADVKAVQHFLGTVTYLSKFIPNLSIIITELLCALIKSDMPWTWTEVQQAAFDNLKPLVVVSPVLRYFDTPKSALIQTDASSTGLGSCLMQDGAPIAFASRALTDCETQYVQIEKEMLAIVFACEKFAHYVYGQLVTVQSDHKPLESVFKKSITATISRLQRMLLRLLKFQLRVDYLPGKSMYITDTLSCAHLTEPLTRSDCELSDDIELTVHTVLHKTSISNTTLEEIREATSTDATLTELHALIANGFPSETSSLSSELKAYQKLVADMHEVDGLLVHNNKVIIPLSLRPKMLSIIHEGYLRMEKCKLLARQSLYWPGLTRDIEEFIRKCSTCNKYRRKQQQEPLFPHPVPHCPWQKLGADIFSLRNKDYLLIVHYYSKYPEISMLHDKTASSVITNMKSVFARHGVPDQIMADNMPFASKDITTFSKDWNFNIISSSPNYAQSNGQAERTIQTVKCLLKKAMDSGCDPYVPLLQ